MADRPGPASTARAMPAGASGATVTSLPPRPPRHPQRFLPSAGRRSGTGVLHSRIVGFLRVVLPASAVSLAVLFFAWPYWQPSERGFRIRPISISTTDLDNLNAVGARFVGLDGNNQPFTLMADQAVQATAASAMELDRPQGDITQRDGTWLSVMAKRGAYFRSANKMTLTGEVSLFQDGGYEFHTESADIDLKRNEAEGTSPVRGQGPGLQIQGNGFRILDRGQRVIVTGPSRLVLTPSATPPVKK